MSRVVQGGNGITLKYNALTHKGVDIGWRGGDNDNVLAHSSGVVVSVVTGKKNNTKATGNATYGNYVKIKHDNGYYTLYAHLSEVYVKVGQRAEKGAKIGYIGDSGKAYGKHLHFEVRNTKDVRIDPTPYLNNDLPNMTTWTTGNYKLLVSKAIRTNHTLGNNIVKVGRCMTSIKNKLTSTNPNADAYYKVGTEVKITDIYKESNGRVWGKLTNTWIVLCNVDGTHQAEKVS